MSPSPPAATPAQPLGDDDNEDEEALVAARGRPPGRERRAEGAYYTPRPLVEWMLDAVAPLATEARQAPLRIVDPACGAGAFLSAAAKRYPGAELVGIELDDAAAALCRERVPRARVVVGDGLRRTLTATLATLPPRFELWLGNPPYNGTSPLLGDRQSYDGVRRLLDAALPRGTSLRDDFAFFLLLARDRLSHVPGVLAFVTPSTLLDGYLYAPLRRALLDRLELRQVLELGSGAFVGTRVRACVTVWRSHLCTGERIPARAGSATARPRSAPAPLQPGVRAFRRASRSGPFVPAQVVSAGRFVPAEPDWLLRPAPAEAHALDAAWRAGGELLTELIPVSLPGLKTRFNELLVDEDRDRLLARLSAFTAVSPRALTAFCRDEEIPFALLPKLRSLKDALPRGFTVRPENIRPFYLYAGARHRGHVPETARRWCYLDRALIPRGDHRLRGAYDPHREPVKLLFNIRELPLSAALLDSPGCVHDHRHARFAPLWVPERIWQRGLGAARAGVSGPSPKALGRPVPNLSDLGRQWAERAGGPRALFLRIADFINSAPVQEVWAPAFGASRTLPVNEAALETTLNGPPNSSQQLGRQTVASPGDAR